MIGAHVRVGPYCCIGNDTEIGEGTVLRSHVVISGHTRIGRDNIIYPFATIGEDNQDLKYAGEATVVEVGDRNRLRESVTIHRGTVQGGGLTKVGNDNLLILLCHKCNLTSPQHGQRGSLLAIARAMSNRNVEIESGTCRWTRPAAAREVTFG